MNQPASFPAPYQQQVFSLISSIIGQNNIIAIPIEFVRFTGDFNTAVLLTQLVCWHGRGKDPEGWIYKTYDQWTAEITLSKHQVSRSAKTLSKMGILETKVKRVKLNNGMYGDRTVHYLLKQENFIDLFSKHLSIEINDGNETSLAEKPYGKKEPSSFSSSERQKSATLSAIPDKVPSDSKAAINLADAKRVEISLAELVELAPAKMKTKAVVVRIKQAIDKGVDVGLIRGCIYLTNEGSDRKTIDTYDNHLGRCIDGEWALGCKLHDITTDTTTDATREKAFLESRRGLSTYVLIKNAKGNKATGKKPCKVAIKILKERGVKF